MFVDAVLMAVGLVALAMPYVALCQMDPKMLMWAGGFLAVAGFMGWGSMALSKVASAM